MPEWNGARVIGLGHWLGLLVWPWRRRAVWVPAISIATERLLNVDLRAVHWRVKCVIRPYDPANPYPTLSIPSVSRTVMYWVMPCNVLEGKRIVCYRQCATMLFNLPGNSPGNLPGNSLGNLSGNSPGNLQYW